MVKGISTKNLAPLPVKKMGVAQRQQKIPSEYQAVARGMETQFLNHMLTQMNKSILQEKADSSSTNYYKSLLNYERAKMMAEKNGGVGIQKLVLDEIYPQRIRDYKNGIKNFQTEKVRAQKAYTKEVNNE